MSDCKRQYAGCHLLRVFFEDFSAWRRLGAQAGFPADLSQQEYDDLLKGTAADIYIPLWASACLSGMDILLNEITLEAILFYKKYGYSAVRMDGNPPDYIGEQFRFLEYLYRCALDGDREAARAAQQFADDFTLDTVREMGRALRAQSRSAEALAVLGLAEQVLTGGGPGLDDAQLHGFDSWDWRRQPPLPAEEARVVPQASFNDCGGKCRILATVREGCVLSVAPDKESELRFSGCPRGAAYRPTFLSSRRLRYPMERVGQRGEGRFRRISWEEAVRKTAEAIKSSRADGPCSRFVMHGAGVESTLSGQKLAKRLLALDGGYLSYYSTYSIGGALAVLPRMFGQLEIGNHESEILRSKLLILWGNNLVSTHFGTEQKRMLMRAKEQGTRIVVIDPRQSDTALACADQWIAIRPSSDAAMADAMAWVIWKNDLYDHGFVRRFCQGFEKETLPPGVPADESYFAYLAGEKDGVPKTPQWAEAITGVPAADIESLALEYAQARWGCILPGLGPQRTLNGEQNYRSILALACLTGGLAQPGGGLIMWRRPGPPRPDPPEVPNPCGVSIPVFQWWRAVDCPETLTAERGLQGAERLESPVRLIFSMASGMLLNQHSDINHTLQILRRGDGVRLIVLSDLFMTPSARCADLLLPAPSFFETENISPPWNPDSYVLYNYAAIEPIFGTRLEQRWLTDVARWLGLLDAFAGGKETEADWLRESWETLRAENPEMIGFDEFRRKGIFVWPGEMPTITFEKNIKEGVPFPTPSGKIEIFSQELYDRALPDVPAIPGYVAAEEGPEDARTNRYPLQLVGYHSRRRCHSIHDRNPWLEELEPPRLWIHPEDAACRGIGQGELVEVLNDRGRVRIPAWVTRRIARGAVAMCEGAWYTPDRDGADTRGSINTLTMSHRATPLGNANPQHTNLVEVKKAEK